MRTVSGIVLAILIGLLPSIGCGSSGLPAEVEGTVIYDGQPVPSGIVSFLPADGGEQPSGGGFIHEGKYRVYPESGLKPGNYRVEIRWGKKVGQKKDAGYGESPDIVEEGLPAKYHTESTLTAELKAGPNQVDFNLEK